MPARLCVVGSSNMDLVVRTPRLPLPGETLRADGFFTCPGGKGGNQAVMAARLGAEVAFVGRVGNDVFGEALLANYRAEGIHCTHIGVDRDRPTGTAAILVDAHGENHILLVPGANEGLTPKHVRQARDVIRAADVVVCQLEVPPESTAEALRLAQRGKAITILNPAPFQPLSAEVLENVQVLVPNEVELRQLAQRPCDTPEQMEKVAQRLFATTGGEVLVTLGERGILSVGGTGTWREDAVTVKAVDTSGAGDAFIGALAAFLARRVPWIDTVRRAMAVAALSVTRPGTQSSYPTRREAERFLRQRGLMKRG